MEAVPRQLIALYGHFVELDSAFKQSIWALSTTKGAAKCPSKFIAEIQPPICSSLNSWPSHPAARNSNQEFQYLHLKCMRVFSSGAQNASWMEGKAVEQRGNTDQKNHDNELAWKHSVNDVECLEAAKNRKIVAESSIKLVE